MTGREDGLTEVPLIDETLVWNGIDAETGEYHTRPRSWDDLVECILSCVDPSRSAQLKTEVSELEGEELPDLRGEPPPDVDVRDLASAGWGVVFTGDADPETRDALAELLEHRQDQAGDRYQVFEGVPRGYLPGDDRNRWLTRQGVGPGVANPDRVPYYLMLVGSPSAIPFEIQFDLGVRYAVGRLAFDTPEEYARYARNVLEVETSSPRSRKLTFFGVQNPDDLATAGSMKHLIVPVRDYFQDFPGWETEAVLQREATKIRLGEILREEAPAVLFTASHGMAPGQRGRLFDRVGAILCDEYPGPKAWQGRIPPEFYFSAADVPDGADLTGLIAVLFGCYTVGMPEHDSFCRVPPRRLGPEPMISPLAQRLLGKERGALAAIGHVDRAWDFSLVWEKAGSQPQTFKAVLGCLLEGQPVGAAARFLGDRYADLGLDLKQMLLDFLLSGEVDRDRLPELWVAEADARSYMVLGDPAVRLSDP